MSTRWLGGLLGLVLACCHGDDAMSTAGDATTSAAALCSACDDGDPCTWDYCSDDACSHLPAADGAPCSGGQCTNGICIATVSCDDGDPCTKDVPSGSGCAHLPLLPGCTPELVCAPGVLCDDGNACTVDACFVGVGCTHQFFCPPPADPCDWVDCDDGDPCTTDDCDGAFCTHHKNDPNCKPEDICIPMDCDDGNQCTKDVCTAQGCVHSMSTGPCDDGDACTVGDHCVVGVCVSGSLAPCDDGDPCTLGDHCVAGACVPGGPAPCDDGDPCTLNDVCIGGVCAGIEMDCSYLACGLNSCGACECVNGTCSHTWLPSQDCCDTADDCNDDDEKTLDDCAEWTCVHLDVAFPKGSLPTLSSACFGSVSPADQSCDDTDACSQGDKCTALGTCAPGTASACSPDAPGCPEPSVPWVGPVRGPSLKEAVQYPVAPDRFLSWSTFAFYSMQIDGNVCNHAWLYMAVRKANGAPVAETIQDLGAQPFGWCGGWYNSFSGPQTQLLRVDGTSTAWLYQCLGTNPGPNEPSVSCQLLRVDLDDTYMPGLALDACPPGDGSRVWPTSNGFVALVGGAFTNRAYWWTETFAPFGDAVPEGFASGGGNMDWPSGCPGGLVAYSGNSVVCSYVSEQNAWLHPAGVIIALSTDPTAPVMLRGKKEGVEPWSVPLTGTVKDVTAVAGGVRVRVEDDAGCKLKTFSLDGAPIVTAPCPAPGTCPGSMPRTACQ